MHAQLKLKGLGAWLMGIGLALVLQNTLASPTSKGLVSEASVPGQCLGKDHAQGSAKRLSVGVVPQLPAAETLRRWSPFLESIGESLDLCFVLSVSASIPAFESEFKQGRYDLAFMNPYHQVMAFKAQGYEPLLADTRLLTGILVVAKDSPFKNLKDLQGEAISFPAPNAFAASLLIRSILAEQGVRFKASYVKTHTNVYRSVALGTANAGGGVNNTLLREPESLRSALRILYETPGFRPHPFSAHPRVPAELRLAITKHVLQMSSRPEQQLLLNQVQIPNPAQASHKKDYESLQRLGIEAFVVNENSN
ncbi:MAG: phosphate/phosphite/phosphonate ABC transporter substrate-binding protein [Burkholderiaceae bacterium]|jgi:phosphonate transport system substrate-binding protein